MFFILERVSLRSSGRARVGTMALERVVLLGVVCHLQGHSLDDDESSSQGLILYRVSILLLCNQVLTWKAVTAAKRPKNSALEVDLDFEHNLRLPLSGFFINSLENEDEFESKPLVASEGGNLVKLKDVLEGPQTLAFQLKPKNQIFEGLDTDIETAMHLANARQTKIDDATDDDIPSTWGRQFTDATFSDSSHSKVSKVRHLR
ncbi:hypothetical protein TEA_030025 [Camellia sinensis var. sinensis]|uniref:Uncharacterized protein n=1 Tax=Camellia sinensis var. sinensis TaxID=542762 RepID=A0A4S4DU85_CAMSN|nr:hypothetical protein TEA_030025 [Camellia sinensis var. sinensis]